jgi:hypothetical protein
MKLILACSVAVFWLAMLARAAGAGEAPKFVICNFDDAADLGKLEHDKNNVELTIGPRTPTEMNSVMKYTVLGGQYPGFSFNAPKSIPKDWSGYEALSLVVWTNDERDLGIRIDDEKSFNYASRYNGGTHLTKGRTLVQIPIKNIAKAIDVTKIKYMVIFTCDPPKGLTMWFDNLQLGPLQADKVDFVPYAERYDLNPSLEFVTPHLPLARNLAGGPVPVFMLSSVKYGREVPEMMQRLDLKVSQLTWDREWGANTWGFGDFYGKRGHSVDYVLMQKYLDSSMQGPEKFGAMVMYTPLGWNRFTKSAREMIVKRVKENGEGLVMLMPFPGDKDQPWPDDLKEACALIDSKTDWLRDGCDVRYANEGRIQGKRWTKTKDHPITAGVPLEALPFAGMETQKYEPAPGAEVLIQLESGEPVLAVKQLGKGRVVTFATRALSLTPLMNGPEEFQKRIPYRFWEAWYSLENRAICWAAGREFTRAGEPVELKAEGEHADPYFAARQWKNAEGKVTDWELVFTAPKADVQKCEIKVPEAVNLGEPIVANFTLPANVEGAEWVALLGEMIDCRWRTLERITVDPKAAAVELSTARVRSYMAYIKVEARKQGVLVASGSAELVVTPPAIWDDYEIHSWLEGGLPFLQDHEMKRMREFGLTCNTISPWDYASGRRLFRGGMRVHGCGLTQALHPKDLDGQEKKYKETKDKQYLVRNPSYADPAVVTKERKQAGDYAAGLAKFAPLSFIMSDETALTSYTREFDYDFHPENVAQFRAKLKTKFGEIGALNAALGTNLKSFDELQPPASDEAKAAKNFGLWNEWRAHNDDMWAGAFKMYADALKEKWPPARISVSGTQEQAIFNGIDWAKLTPVFEAISGYGGRFQELQRLSFHPGALRVTPWGGYGRSGRSVDHQVWSSLVTGGSGMGLFWWYSLRDADLTFCKSGKDYQRIFKEVRAGIGKQYMLSRRQFSPVAVLWSANSQRASWSLGKFDEFKKRETLVMDSLHAAEFDPYFVSETALADGELLKRGTKALLLPMSISLGLGAKKGGLDVIPALEKFVAGGGMVVATDPVQFDEFLQPAAVPEPLAGKFVKFDDIKGDLVAALAKAGVKPWVRASAPDGSRVKNVEVVVHKIPGGQNGWLVTVLRAPVGAKDVVGADGVIHSVPDAEGGKEIEPLVLDLTQFPGANCYDIRKKQFVKPVDGKLTVEMRAGDGLPLALLPYNVGSSDVKVDIKDRALNVDWKLNTDSAKKEILTHVFRVEATDDATGKADENFCANVTTGRVTFPLAFEDANRKFTVRVQDILSGQTATAQVTGQ